MSNKIKLILVFIFCVLLSVFCVLYYRHHENKSEVIFFDVGQGDSALINLPGNNEILIDGGPDMSVLYKLGKYLPVYNRDIELMILTHPHDDHVTGLVEVLRRYKVKQVMYTGVKYESGAYQEFLNLISRDAIPKFAQWTSKGVSVGNKKIQLDEKNFLEIIYPGEDFAGREFENQNDNSVVVKLDTLDKRFLFMGDIEMNIEEEILACVGMGDCPVLEADILKVGHHGSKTSSGQEFLEAVSPDWAVISCGKDNKFGHPSLRTIRRLERLVAEVLRTDEIGDVVFKIKN